MPLAAILFGALLVIATAHALGKVWLRSLPVPPELTLGIGAPLLSLGVFLLLTAGWAGRATFLMLAVAAMAAQLRIGAAADKHRAIRLNPLIALVFGAYAVFYFVHALAPEVLADGITYHLGLVAEYFRLGRFPGRVGFYEVMPQGAEMLYLAAFAFGRHSAAKLVEFALLLASVPLMVRLGRRLQVPEGGCWLAAALYFCAPVTGIAGTSSYNDAGLVFFTLATAYLLLAWDEARDRRYLLAAGLTAGFCYAIKFPGGAVAVLAVVFLLWRRAPKQVWLLIPGGLLTALPWIARDALLTGNPVAPLFNSWFPNAYFHVFSEHMLAQQMRSYGGVKLWQAPYELAMGGRLEGVFGPLLLAMPLGVLAWRRREGRWCWAAALVLAAPWWWNHGARFLMPAFPFLALALAMALPRRAAWAALAVEAALCWPAVVGAYPARFIWRLDGFPVRAALRLEPESAYLAGRLDEYVVARMVERATPPGERVFSLMASAKAYLDREVLDFWHSALADTLTDTLNVAYTYRDTLYDWGAAWPARNVRGIRFRLTRASIGEWCIHEVRLYLGEDRVFLSPQWTLRARPDRWEAPFAVDGNLATRWRTWGPMQPGMYLEIDFDRPQRLTRAGIISHTPLYGVPMEIDGRGDDGRWRLLSNQTTAVPRPYQDLRRDAMRAIRGAGYRYVLTPSAGGGTSPLGAAMAADPAGWGVTVAAQAGSVYLFRIE